MNKASIKHKSTVFFFYHGPDNIVSGHNFIYDIFILNIY